VKDVYKKGFIRVDPDMDIYEIARVMLREKISLVGVRGGGVICKKDLLRFFKGDRKVRDLMSSPAIVVNPLHSINHILRVMTKHDISSVIVEEKGLPIGVISLIDILLRANDEQECQLAKDIMTSKVVKIHLDELATKACKIMLEKNISILPVVDKYLEGVILKTDIIREMGEMKNESK
jgi:CBS domain-containing protein